jgi:hypothetical protein
MSTYVVCIDGTWNGPGDPQTDPIDPAIEAGQETNVYHLFRYLTDEWHPWPQPDRVMERDLRVNRQQPTPGRVLYLAGVGTSGSWLPDEFAGAIGYGTMGRILAGYRFLAEHYRDRDRIFGFGFSRGAYAVRSLAGLLHHVGLPRAPRLLTDAEIDDVEWRYRNRLPAPQDFRPVGVEFLGLWDTVAALLDTSFHDASPPNVRGVAHALALDEQRQWFEPTYWTSAGQATKVEEVWFAGAHANIGGGYENAQLSNIALSWMISRAVQMADLPAASDDYIPHWYNENTFALATDSYREFLVPEREFLAPLGRLSHLIKGAPRQREILPTHGVHMSVFDRIERVKDSLYVTTDVRPDQWPAYRPAALVNGRPVPDLRTQFTGPIAETHGYLGHWRAIGRRPRALVVDNRSVPADMAPGMPPP